jgi:hypothetical protein
MDQPIYKFWEDQFMNLEQTRKQIEDMTKWIMEGFSGFEVPQEPLGKFWDIDFWSAEAQNYMKLWGATAEDFKKHLTYYLDMLGWVPKDEHSELIKQYNRLNEKVANQAKEIAKQKEMVTDQKELVKALKKEVSGEKSKVSKQKKIVADQKEKIADQKKIVADLKKETSDQNKSIKQLQKQING